MNSVIKISFAAIGAITGITISKVFLQPLISESSIMLLVYAMAALLLGALFYISGTRIISIVLEYMEIFEQHMRKMTIYEIAISAGGLILGLLAANLVTIPINKIDIIGTPISVVMNILFGSLGIVLAQYKKGENIFDSAGKLSSATASSMLQPKVLDTSVIIDGRVADICASGFIEGELIIPSFVLEELRHIADSSDVLKRNRGRRGLDVLNSMQSVLKLPIRIEELKVPSDSEVDTELLKLAKKLGGKVITTDYNLSKVADFQKVPVLNINDLSNALKPIALPGEEMTVQVIKDGRESDQGIGYLEDGTMIVIEGGRRHIGESIIVTVTSTLQTAAGRMVFAKPKFGIERVI